MDFLAFAILMLAVACAATTGAMFPTGEWYRQLRKPSWVPPNWVFPLAWTTLYLLMSFAGARVVMLADSNPHMATLALAFWALQIGANALWTPIFFGLRRIKGALPVMAILWVAVAGCLYTHWQGRSLGRAGLPAPTWSGPPSLRR